MSSVDAARVLGPTGLVGPARLRLDRGRVAAVEPLSAATGAAADRTVVPAFVDLQVNGIDDIDVADADGADWEVLDRHLLAQGVTAWCPTLVSMGLDRYPAALARIESARRRPAPRRPRIVGAHLEGPFLGGAAGAHRRQDVVEIDLDWIDSLADTVRVMTLAAEQPRAAEATRRLAARGVLVAIGHTTADEIMFAEVVDAGARLVTHLYNAMSGLHHRQPGVAAMTLAPDPGRPAPSASLIADGVHVHPRMLRLAFAALGERAVLVTDAVAWRGKGLAVADGAPRLADGTLAGTSLTADAAVRTCVGAGIALADACRAFGQRPAALLDLPDRDAVRPGALADLVALDGRLQIEQTWVAGEATLGD